MLYFVVSEGGLGSFVVGFDKPGNPDGGQAFLEIDSPTLAGMGVEIQLRDEDEPDCTQRCSDDTACFVALLTAFPVPLHTALSCAPFATNDCYAWDSAAGAGNFSWCGSSLWVPTFAVHFPRVHVLFVPVQEMGIL